jgi:hypothetical protein
MITRKIGHQGCSLHRCAPAAASFDAFVPLLEGGAATSLSRFAMVRVFFVAALQVPTPMVFGSVNPRQFSLLRRKFDSHHLGRVFREDEVR